MSGSARVTNEGIFIGDQELPGEYVAELFVGDSEPGLLAVAFFRVDSVEIDPDVTDASLHKLSTETIGRFLYQAKMDNFSGVITDPDGNACLYFDGDSVEDLNLDD